jgi:hypothetical protein
MRRILLLLATMTIAMLLASGVAVAAVRTFSNTSPIVIVDGTVANPTSPANPYPSEVTVRGFSGPIRDVNVILNGFRHRDMEHAAVLLVGPEGQKALLMSDVGGRDTWVVGLNLVLDDEATNSFPDQDVTENEEPTDGRYKPTQGTNLDGQGNPVPGNFPSPAPAGPYGKRLSVFDGTDPNGIWQLYVLDDTNGASGNIHKGWSLRIKAPRL